MLYMVYCNGSCRETPPMYARPSIPPATSGLCACIYIMHIFIYIMLCVLCAAIHNIYE